MNKIIPFGTAVFALLASGSLMAWNWGNHCDHQKDISQILDLRGSESLAIIAKAGSLKIVGKSGLEEAEIQGHACADDERALAEAAIETEAGKNAKLYVVLKQDGSSSMDLKLVVPDDLALVVKDSSGDIQVNGTGPINLQDSSGDITLSQIGGDVVIESDSSGDVEGRDVQGSVTVKKDSSGNLEFRHVAESVLVEKDSSGNITVDTVGGDFTVGKDGSGSINASNVAGSISKPD